MGLIAFTKTLAREGAKYGIRSTAIAPVRTPFPFKNPNEHTYIESDCSIPHDSDDDAS